MWVLIGILLAGVLLLVIGHLYFQIGSRRDLRLHPPPGRMVDVGGHRLHLHCTGEPKGTPVIFDAALGASCLSWALVQREVAKFGFTCAFDRAGFGWSDAGPMPRTSARIAEELRLALQRSGILPPYLLVGHSFGGLTIRYFAARYPDEVAGLVFVDPAHPSEWIAPEPRHQARVRAGARLCRRGVWAARLGIARAVAQLARSGMLAPARGGAGFVAGGTGTSMRRHESEILAPFYKLPPELRAPLAMFWTQPKFFEALGSQIGDIVQSAREVEAAGPLPDVPVIVIGGSDQDEDRMARHRALAASVPQGVMIVAPGGHWVQFDSPETIVLAVSKVLEEHSIRLAGRPS